MIRKLGLTCAVTCGCLVVVLLSAFLFRAAVVKGSINLLLGESLHVNTLQGLHVGTALARVDRLELQLPETGLLVILDDLEFEYRRRGWLGLPELTTLNLRRALVQETSPQRPLAAPDDDIAAPPTVATLLQVLRELPVPGVTLTELHVPWWQEPLALNFRHEPGVLQITLASGDAAVVGSFTQHDGSALARFALQLALGGEMAGELQLSLAPDAGHYQVTGSGYLDYAGPEGLPAQLRPSLAALPLKTARLELELSGELADNVATSPPAGLALVLGAGSRLALADGLLTGLDNVTVSLLDRVQLSLVTGAAGHVSTDRLPLRLEGRLDQQPFAADLALNLPACALSAPDTCSPDFTVAATLDALVIPGTDASSSTSLRGLALAGSGLLGIADNTLRLTFEPGLALTLAGWQRGDLQGTAPGLQTQSGLVVSRRTDSGVLSIDAELLAGTLGSILLGEYTVTGAFELRAIRAVQDTNGLVAALALQTQELTVDGAQVWLPAFDLSGNIALTPEVLDFTANLALRGGAEPLSIDLQGQQELAAGAGTAQLSLAPLVFAGTDKALSSYLADSPHEADLAEGSVAMQAELAWQPAEAPGTEDSLVVTGDLNLRLTDLAGYYGTLFFSGLDADIDLVLDSTTAFPLSSGPLRVELAALDAGVPLTRLHADLQLDGAEGILVLSSLYGELFDGTVSTSGQRYVFGSERNVLTFRFDGFRLERLLELAQYEGVQASGAVSGEVPLIFSASGVEVDGGTLFADVPGGNIRYQGAGAGSGNAALDLVNQALANYQYESLESSVDYSPDGELVLGMRLQGYNPDMNQGQRINLNLNLSNNIPSLLESLQAGRAIEDFLQKQFE